MYYIINKETRELIRKSQTPFNVDETVQPELPQFQLKRVDDDTVPTYNAATHKVVRSFVDDDEAATRTFYWEVVPLTQAEIDAYIQQQEDATVRQQIKDNYLALKNGTGTQAERLRRVEIGLAFVVREIARSNGFAGLKK